MPSLRQLEKRLKFCCLRDSERTLTRSILGLSGEPPAALRACARRAWPELAAKLTSLELFWRAGYARRSAYKRIKQAFSLPPAEWRMLCRLDLFYAELAARFPSRSYAEIYALVFHSRNRKHPKTLSLSLTLIQKRVADLLLGLDGCPPADGMFAVVKKLFPHAKSNEEVKRHWWSIKYSPRAIIRKIEDAWKLSDNEYQALIDADLWYLKLSRAFPDRTSETLKIINECLIRKQVASTERGRRSYSNKRAEEKDIFLRLSKTALWMTLSQKNRSIIASYYGFDLPGSETRSATDAGKQLGIDKSNVLSRIKLIKNKLKNNADPTQPSVSLGRNRSRYYSKKINGEKGYSIGRRDKSNKSKSRSKIKAGNGISWCNILEYYRYEIMQFPEMSDEEIKECVTHFNNGNPQAFGDLFHAGLRYVLPAASAWYIPRVVRETGFDVLDLAQEANINFWRSLRSFKGETQKEYREFIVEAARDGIKRALKKSGMSIKINPELTAVLRKISRVWNQLEEKLQREPNANDLAVFLEMPVKEMEEVFKMMQVSVKPHLSLDQMISDDSDGDTYHEVVSDPLAPPDKVLEMEARELRDYWITESVERSLRDLLSPVEQYVMSLRYGFQGDVMTKEAVASELKVDVYIIDKIETKALAKLRSHPEVIENIRRFAFWCG